MTSHNRHTRSLGAVTPRTSIININGTSLTLNLTTKTTIEVLFDNVFPILPTADLLSLSCTSKLFSTLCSDETLWKRKLISDFNFAPERTARTSGWKFIYRGLSNPKEKANGRLGLSKFPRSTVNGVPFPTQLRIRNAQIIDLVAGGMSFHALDTKGNIYVWGTLDGSSSALRNDGYSEAGQVASSPLKLLMPNKIRSISCGRLHSSCLDAERKVWTFINWGRPFYLSSPLLTNHDSIPSQVECGWSFSSVLTVSGDVFVWWPLSGRMHNRIQQKFETMNLDGDKKAPSTPNREISCVTWKLDMDPVRLPSIPTLPELSSTGNRSDKRYPQLVKIAALDRNIIGLTNEGHVLQFGGLDNETSASQGRWEYLPKFSDINEIRENLTLQNSASNGKNGGFPPKTMQITHISANFMYFTAYSTGSSSVVLLGDCNTTPESEPKVIAALQNKAVISVVIGDYHNAALTATGKLLTWGAFSAGALGLGDPTEIPVGSPGGFAREEQRIMALEHRGRARLADVEVPTEVRFDHRRKISKDRFCFSVTAAGWHTGALVIDLEPDEDEDLSDEELEDPRVDIQPIPDYRQWETPPIVPLPGIFRIGHAGRGLLGRGRGRDFRGGHLNDGRDHGSPSR
ncbi:regulator of chromosome condensation 1/beta-lactamase-inhibitor protein II [Cyathus striatus]|nr:regulator of chromosome condensation 1/beta-lactamase-inhibitor protein II [Cyathus striatus]